MSRMKVYIIFLSVLFIGCDKELDFDGFKNTPEVVVQSHFTTDSVFHVLLGLSSDIMQTGFQNKVISDAEVVILDSLGNIIQLVHTSNGHYRSTEYPKEGMPYRLDIRTSDGKNIRSRDLIPSDSLKASVDTVTGPANRLDLKLKLNDPANSENRYILRLLEYSTHYQLNEKTQVIDSVTAWHPMSIISSNNIFEISNSLRGNVLNFEMFEDEFFDGQQYLLNVMIDRVSLLEGGNKSVSSKLMVYLKSVNDPCYQYYLGILKNSRNYGGPFSTNFNPEDKIENGHGIFSGYRFYQKIIDLK